MRHIKIIGDEFKHCQYSNNPLPPTSFFPDIKWMWGQEVTVDDVCVYTHSQIEVGIKSCAKIKILWLLEPYELIPNQYELIKSNNQHFDFVFTHEKALLDLGQNYKFIPFGGCWIPESQRTMPEFKDKLVSIISSEKAFLFGHKLRHEIIKIYGNKLDVYGRGYTPVPSKVSVHKDYFYSVVIENCKRDYWFTEKLIDCLIMGCIPIYWGCPSIADVFDINGFIIVDTIEDVGAALNSISVDLYLDKFKSVSANQELAKKYVLAERFIQKNFIDKELI
jgi:hypothetical protein